MNKYTHVKQAPKPLRIEQQRAIDIRKEENFKTAERIYGPDSPKFGAPLGVSYDPVNGVITKTNRAASVL